MKPHPIEFRQRILSAVDRQEQTVQEIAEIFEVTERYVYKLLKLRRETGDISPRPHGGGAVAKLDEAKRRDLEGFVREYPDATLAELQELLRRKSRVKVSINTIWRVLRQIGFSLKKNPGGREKPIRKTAPNSKKRK